MIYDPEEIGYMLRKIITDEIKNEEERTDDFQDMELWRILTIKTAEQLMNKYKKHLIVPMTIYKADNFEYIFNGFKSLDQDVYHFCLIASEDTIKKRIERRGDNFGSWYQTHTKEGVLAFRDNRFQEHINTDHIGTEEVIRLILNKIVKSNDVGSSIK